MEENKLLEKIIESHPKRIGGDGAYIESYFRNDITLKNNSYRTLRKLFWKSRNIRG